MCDCDLLFLVFSSVGLPVFVSFLVGVCLVSGFFSSHEREARRRRITQPAVKVIGLGFLPPISTHPHTPNQHHPPARPTNRLQEWLNVLQSVLLSFSLLPVLHFTSSARIMGPHKSGRTVTALIWLLAFGVLAINIYLVVSRIGGGQPWWVYTLTVLLGIVYLAFSYSLVQDDIAAGYRHFYVTLPENIRRCLPPPASGGSGGSGGGGGSADGGGGGLGPPSPMSRQLVNPLIDSDTDAAVEESVVTVGVGGGVIKGEAAGASPSFE
jgi:hypothetical protein